jgi:hypothetical protein
MSKLPLIVVAAAALIFGSPPAARASVVFSVQSVSASPGDVNDLFEVDVTNTGPLAVQLSAFNFVVHTSSSDITLKQATTGTLLHPYVFAGNSLLGPIISTLTPGPNMDGGDLPFNLTATTIAPAATFGLGEVSFDVAPGAPAEILQIMFDTTNTSATDQNTNPIALSFTNGQITILSATPLPAALPLFATGLGALGLLGWRRKRKGTP